MKASSLSRNAADVEVSQALPTFRHNGATSSGRTRHASPIRALPNERVSLVL